MQESAFRRRLGLIVPALSVAVAASFVLATWSFYSSHKQACDSRNATLNAVHDVLVIATRPRPGQKITPERQHDLNQFRQSVFTRINNARC